MALTESNEFAIGKKAPDFSLRNTVNNKMLSLIEAKGEKGTVIMFICNHCPFVIHVNTELIKMANEGYEQNKADASWMERTANILDKKGCTDAPIFFTIAKELHASNPSSVSAEKMGIMSLKGKEYGAAENFFQQAINLAQDETKKADYYIELAQSQSSAGKYGPARTNARKAASLKSGWGLPYLMIGDMIAGSSSCGGEDACKQKAIYWLAADYYAKAKSIDPSV